MSFERPIARKQNTLLITGKKRLQQTESFKKKFLRLGGVERTEADVPNLHNNNTFDKAS
jgi:hypothetical protein